jgi:hypothetical protein
MEDTFLFQYPLRSFSATTDRDDRNNFTHRILVGYDTGDRLLDNQTTLAALHQWAARHLLPNAALTTHPIPNPSNKPGPVMNHLSRKAHATGCDFLYRINDDTQLITPWTHAFVSTLASFSPPNVGVVGPTCHEGNTAILTHDFVHRSHLDIFGFHYPPELTDWWLDDWITQVYGEMRTLKLASVVVVHHVVTTRYEVTWGKQPSLKALVEEGGETLATFLKKNHSTPYTQAAP